jgi:hypothetical protein
MSIRGRLDRIADRLAPKGLFGGACMEDLSRFGFFSGEPASNTPAHVHRLAVYAAIYALTLDLHDPERAAEAREELGIDEFTPAEEIRQRLLVMGIDAGFTRREMAALSELA